MAVWDCVGSCRASTGGRMVPGLPVGCCGGPGCLVVAVWDCGGLDVAMGTVGDQEWLWGVLLASGDCCASLRLCGRASQPQGGCYEGSGSKDSVLATTTLLLLLLLSSL